MDDTVEKTTNTHGGIKTEASSDSDATDVGNNSVPVNDVIALGNGITIQETCSLKAASEWEGWWQGISPPVGISL